MKLAVVLALAASLPAVAQVKLNDFVTVNGWSTASYQYAKPSSGSYADSLNVDAALLGVVVTPTKDVTGTFSMFYKPGGVISNGNDVTLLDAYVSWDAGNGVTLSAGKFLSYLGYESFYAINDNMITLANQQFLAPIPGYHQGFKLDYAPDKSSAMGFSVADSEYWTDGAATRSDGELKHNAGFEAYYTYSGVPGLTVWGGVGYQTKTSPGVDGSGVWVPSAITVGDLWVSYQINKSMTIALEEIYKDGGLGNKGSNWLAYLQYSFTDKASTWFAVSGEDVSGGSSYTKYSISPTYAITANLSVRAQYSYTKYSGGGDINFLGAQVLFKF